MLPLLPLSEVFAISARLRRRRPLSPERLAWDGVLTGWLMGCVGWLPALLLDRWDLLPLCAVGVWLPTGYRAWRWAARAGGRLGCDWLPPCAPRRG